MHGKMCRQSLIGCCDGCVCGDGAGAGASNGGSCCGGDGVLSVCRGGGWKTLLKKV